MKKIVPLLVLGKVLLAQDLSPIIVNSKKVEEKTSLNQHINSDEIEEMVTGNGDIPSLLKTNPNVKVIENKSDPSSIEPAKIEINEAKYYQNNFILDGLSADSLLDPVSTNRIDDVKGNENEVFIDTFLIDKISVFDSGISAEYGGFSGGVVDVKLKNPSAIPSGKVSYRHTSDSFAKIHSPIKSNTSLKPQYDKKSFNATYSGPINENNGIIFSFSKKESTKPVEFFDSFKNLKNESSNFLLKYTNYFEDDGLADLSIIHSPYKSEGIKNRFTKDSEYTSKGGGTSLNGHIEKNINDWELDSNISIKTSENTRETKTSYLKYWRKTNSKDWGNNVAQGEAVSAEGSWGDIKKTQKSILSKIKLKKTFDNHHINTGLELNYIQGTHKRDNELFIYKEPDSTYTGVVRCNGSVEDCVEKEQFFTRRDIYQSENVNANMLSSAYYLEDDYKIKNYNVKLGLRADYNNYLKNFDVAPRLNLQGNFFKDKLKIFAGANRYYGKSFLAHKLREARTPFKSEYRSLSQGQINNPNVPAKNNPSIWSTSSEKGDDIHKFSNLNTPYTDEGLVGLTQLIGNNVLKVKYINRKAKEQFTMNRGEQISFTRPDGVKAYYHPKTVSNKGSSSSDIYTLTFENVNKIKFLSSELRYSFSLRKSESKTNFTSYDTNDEESTFFVKYNGNTVDSSVIENYNRPIDYSLFVNFKTPSVNFFDLKGSLNSSLFFTYRPSYTKPISTKEKVEEKIDGEVEVLSIYKDQKVKDSKNIDLRLAFDTKFGKKQRLRLTADVFNLLDSISGENAYSYEIGRSFWLGAEYKF